MQLVFQGIIGIFLVDKKGRTARSRHSPLYFVPTTNIFIINLLLKRIVKIGDKGKRA